MEGRKIMKKITIRIVAAAMIVAAMISSVAFAADARASAYISSKAGFIIPKGNGNMIIEFSLTATGMMDELGASDIDIYKADGTFVENIQYTDPGYSNMMTTNNYSYLSSISWSGEPGESYYAIIIFYAKNSKGYDYRGLTTPTVQV